MLCLGAQAHGIGLYQAFSSGQISISGQSSSSYSETKLVVRNLRTYSLEVDFSTACLVQNNSSQRVGLAYEKRTGSYYLRLSANTTYTLYFSSRCLDRSRSSPSTGVSYTTILDITQFTQIVNCLRNNYTQSSVWAITDDSGAYSQSWKTADPRYVNNPPPGGGGGGGGGYNSNLDLSGNVRWSTSGSQINIQAGKVANNSSSSTSGSLRLRIWATRSRYAGGGITGYVLGTRNLSSLRPNYYYSNISGNVSYTRPPSGTYYTTMTLEEYSASGWVIRDYINFSSTTRF
jgi:hypothetical protein